jgi:hypothetical protein
MALDILSLCANWGRSATSRSSHSSPILIGCEENGKTPEPRIELGCDREETVTIQTELFQLEQIMNSSKD